MSAVDLPDRPTFRSAEQDLEIDAPPISRMAIIALALGVFSLLAPLSLVLLPLCMLAVALGAVSLIKILRDPGLGGARLAQLGLALGIASAFWSVTAASGRRDYLFAEAAKHAQVFLGYLAEGKKYEALELLNPQVTRQLAGTNLERYYENAEMDVKATADGFLSANSTNLVLQAGPDADWQFLRGVEVKNVGPSVSVTVQMRNTSAAGEPEIVEVSLQRSTSDYGKDKAEAIARWHVLDLELP